MFGFRWVEYSLATVRLTAQRSTFHRVLIQMLTQGPLESPAATSSASQPPVRRDTCGFFLLTLSHQLDDDVHYCR
jgi:hypothetical protein